MDKMDKELLFDAIEQFKYYCKSSNPESSAPCTVQELNKVVEAISVLMTTFVQHMK